ncbi:MAG: formylglycine-generating enzyme family protein [Planctomycetota bacterium]
MSLAQAVSDPITMSGRTLHTMLDTMLDTMTVYLERLNRTFGSIARTARRGTAALLAGVACVGASADEPARSTDDVAKPFKQSIEGTVVSFEMVPLPAGTVTIDGQDIEVGPVWIGRTEVTWDAFDVYMLGLDEPADAGGVDAVARPSKPYISMDRGFGHGGYPVISISYHSAQTFCAWLSKKTGRTYRLPTEAEWRHACTLGGVDESTADEHAWHFGNARFTTHPVGKKAADAVGLHDLHGNAGEWCTGVDGAPVTMGGTYRSDADELGCASRVPPSDAWNASDPQIPKSIWWLADGGFIGFRLVCEPAAPEAGATE